MIKSHITKYYPARDLMFNEAHFSESKPTSKRKLFIQRIIKKLS